MARIEVARGTHNDGTGWVAEVDYDATTGRGTAVVLTNDGPIPVAATVVLTSGQQFNRSCPQGITTISIPANRTVTVTVTPLANGDTDIQTTGIDRYSFSTG